MKLAHLNPILAGMEGRRAKKRDWHREREGGGKGETHTKTNETMKKTEREAAVQVQGCSREAGMTGV